MDGLAINKCARCLIMYVARKRVTRRQLKLEKQESRGARFFAHHNNQLARSRARERPEDSRSPTRKHLNPWKANKRKREKVGGMSYELFERVIPSRMMFLVYTNAWLFNHAPISPFHGNHKATGVIRREGVSGNSRAFLNCLANQLERKVNCCVLYVSFFKT